MFLFVETELAVCWALLNGVLLYPGQRFYFRNLRFIFKWLAVKNNARRQGVSLRVNAVRVYLTSIRNFNCNLRNVALKTRGTFLVAKCALLNSNSINPLCRFVRARSRRRTHFPRSCEG